MTQRPLPDVDDPVTQPFWRATRESRLVIPRCEHCGYLCWPPEPLCPECWHSAFTWEEQPTTGTLYSYAVYHRAFHPGFADMLPYTVGLVELPSGPKLYGLMSVGGDSLRVGQAVRAVFRPVDDAVTLVEWAPAEPAPEG